MKSTRKSATARLDLSVQYAVHDAALPLRPALRKWVKAACPAGGEVTLRFVDAEESRALNSNYRGKDYATNVLSFPYAPPPGLAGDLVVCVPVVLREAQEGRRDPQAHFAHLIVHGMLHLQGYGHEQDREAEIMEQKEREILAALGYADPYEDRADPDPRSQIIDPRS